MTEASRPRILVTGASGQVGWELRRCLQPLGDVTATEFDAQGAQASGAQCVLNLADPDSIRSVLREVRPQIIVNAAAYTAVDLAEDDVDAAMAINANAPGVLAEEAKREGVVLVHYSTEYVFDGAQDGAYREDDTTNPLSVYGRSKLAGERAIQQINPAHLILRTSWVYGIRGKNFLLTILRLARERPELNVVDDQVGAPNWSRLLAAATAHILISQFGSARDWADSVQQLQAVSGIYHLSSHGATSWCEFARAIVAAAAAKDEATCEVRGIPTEQYPTRAQRPKNSRLCTDKLAATFGISLPTWDEALRLCMQDMPRA